MKLHTVATCKKHIRISCHPLTCHSSETVVMTVRNVAQDTNNNVQHGVTQLHEGWNNQNKDFKQRNDYTTYWISFYYRFKPTCGHSTTRNVLRSPDDCHSPTVVCCTVKAISRPAQNRTTTPSQSVWTFCTDDRKYDRVIDNSQYLDVDSK